MSNYLYEEDTYKIIGALIEVHKTEKDFLKLFTKMHSNMN
jgi:hypothetical protein